jgi:peptidoglycan/LPS O-acetylase OafA/YrhL
MPSVSANTKIDALTGVRAIAALWVLLLHLNGEFTSLVPPLQFFDWIAYRGSYGVDIFFILSGFILSYTYQETIREMNWNSWSKFIWCRLARIYPAYLVALSVAVGGVAMAAYLKFSWNRESYQPIQLLYEVLMVQEWTFGPNGGWNYPGWSVSAEWFAYLFVFPLTYLGLKKVRSIRQALVLALIPLAVYAFIPIHKPTAGSWGLLQVGLEFVAGAALYRIYFLSPDLNIRVQNWMSIVALTLTFGVLWLGLDTGFQRLIFFAAIAWLIFLLGCKGGALAACLGTGLFVYLGEISYSIYLTHGIDQRILKDVFPVDHFGSFPVFHRLVIFAIYLGSVIGGAALLYHWVEVPARSRMRKIFVSDMGKLLSPAALTTNKP